MLNIEKVKLMTKLALYEQNEGKKAFRSNKFLRSDYISINMIKTAVLATINYGLLLLIWVVYRVDYYMKDITNIHVWRMIIITGITYLLFLTFYLILSYYFYNNKYKNLKKTLVEYNENLKLLHRMYKTEQKVKEEKALGGSEQNVEPFGD